MNFINAPLSRFNNLLNDAKLTVPYSFHNRQILDATSFLINRFEGQLANPTSKPCPRRLQNDQNLSAPPSVPDPRKEYFHQKVEIFLQTSLNASKKMMWNEFPTFATKTPSLFIAGIFVNPKVLIAWKDSS